MMGRPDLFVIGRLLEAMATSPGPVRRTPLQQKAGLNYTVFQRYLDYLLRQGLIAATASPDDLLELTSRGVEAYRFLSDGLVRIFGPANGSATPTGMGRSSRSGAPPG
jgi:predicted transcriptional regulator